MAKRITIAFNEILEFGTGSKFTFDISINGVLITFSNGKNGVDIGYNNTGDIPPTEIKIYPTLNENIEKTLDWLSNGYSHLSLSYSRLENTIQILIDSETAVITNFISQNIGIVLSVENINIFTEGAIKLKYFFEYKNIINDEYRFEIYQVGYTGNFTEIYGKAIIEKATVDNHLDTTRGTSVTVELEANDTLSLQDLYTQNELEFPVKLIKNGRLIFRGYLNPDGVFMSFIDEEWRITLDCVDGLGAINNLSFVQENGTHFIGKMNAQDIVFHCLRRTGLLQNINTAINVFYEGYADLPNRNIFDAIELNADRFVKKDSETIMSCGEVLRSILDIFNAVITQENGEWYIYRPNEIYASDFVDFKRYDISNNYIQTVKHNLHKKLGSQIDNFYPHHCNANQQIQIQGSISAFRINYKYGFISSSILNPNLQHDSLLNYPQWTKHPMVYSSLINDPASNSGIKILTKSVLGNTEKIMTSSNLFLLKGSTFEFKTNLTVFGYRTLFGFKVRLGNYYLKNDGSWETTDGTVTYMMGSSSQDASNFPEIKSVFSVLAQPTPIDGSVYIEVYVPLTFPVWVGLVAIINSVNVLVNTQDTTNKEGEFHTVERANVSSNVKENKEVFNGDSIDEFFNGAIFKTGAAELTEVWSRRNYVESKPLLRIVAEESLRIAQKPLQIFSGGIYGYIPFLSSISINNLKGKFMPIEWRYDTVTNIGTCKLLELYSAEIPDINYKFTFDYGAVTKPTITS